MAKKAKKLSSKVSCYATTKNGKAVRVCTLPTGTKKHHAKVRISIARPVSAKRKAAARRNLGPWLIAKGAKSPRCPKKK